MLSKEERRDLSLIMALFSKEEEERLDNEIESMYDNYIESLDKKGQ